MSGIETAGLALGMISAIISIIDATHQVYEAVKDEAGLPTNFKKSATKLPLISKLLEDAEIYVKTADEATGIAFTPTLEDCRAQAIQLQDLFGKVMPEDGESRWDRYVKAARTIGKGGRVEDLVRRILDDLQLLATRFPEVATQRRKEQLAMAVEEVTKMEPSLPDGFEQMPTYAHYGSGAQNNITGQHINSGGNQMYGSGQQYIGTNHIVNNHIPNKNVSVDDIDRSCLRTLRCPDTLAIKNRLKESKDKLLHKSIEWILQDPQYLDWRNGDDVCLLWIKGGAGKGKTMMSIGLIERLSLLQDESTVVTYFFCQNADYELNTIEAILKGLILQLVNQQKELKISLRSRWDTTNERFKEEITSWRALWDIFLEMLEHCKCKRVYVVVDALDECQDDGIADLLKLLVRTGLHRPSKIKWLLTSRPLDSGERELLSGSDQVLVSLELNSKHVSEAVQIYITSKMDELDRRCSYGETLRRKIQNELTEKAEDTYLWVSLVCKRLESVHRDEALTTIQDLPLGLYPLYHRVLIQLSSGESAAVKGCMRLLRVMMLAYRPLNMAEVGCVSGLSDELAIIEALVDRCASFLKMRGTDIEFVHQSARDYLTGENGQSILNSDEYYGHAGVALGCLSYLSQRLKVNLVDLPRPNSTREVMKWNGLAASVAYAATFWVQHLDDAKNTTTVQKALTAHGEVGIFLHTKLLEWLECLSLLDKLPRAVEAFKTLADNSDLKKNSFLSMLVQDATRFLLRHYRTLATWPLQTYSSAVIFSPQASFVRNNNLDKVPTWLRKLPKLDDVWASLIQTLAGHSGSVWTVAFSPDGKQIASGSADKTIKLWDATTGDLQKTLAGHLGCVRAVAFSRDSKQIASGSTDETIKLWDTRTGDLQKTLVSYSGWVRTIAFSLDGKQIVSGSDHETIKLWDTRTGDIQKTLVGHSGSVWTVAFSLDGKQIASGSADETIKLWDATTGDLQKTLVGHWSWVTAVAFSLDSKQIASGSADETIKLWDATTGDLQKTLVGHSGWVKAVAFSPDGKQIASGSADKTMKLWNTTTGDLQKILTGHSDSISAIAFSLDGIQIVSGSSDKTIKLWDTRISNFQKILVGHSGWVTAVAFSPDSKQIASGSNDRTIKLWDTTTGDFRKTLVNYSSSIWAIAFSLDSKQIASGSDDGTIKLWDIKTGDLQKTLIGHSSSVRAIAFSLDGIQIASGSSDKTIKLWDTRTGDLQKILAGHSGWVTAVAFSPDGKQIASGSDDRTIKLWDITISLKVPKFLGSSLGSHFTFLEWQNIKTSEPVTSLRFSTNGRCLVTNIGEIKIENTLTQGFDFESSNNLWVGNQWVSYGAVPIFLLPTDFESQCYDVRGDQVTIGLRNGRVLSFDIDCMSLNSIYKTSA